MTKLTCQIDSPVEFSTRVNFKYPPPGDRFWRLRHMLQQTKIGTLTKRAPTMITLTPRSVCPWRSFIQGRRFFLINPCITAQFRLVVPKIIPGARATGDMILKRYIVIRYVIQALYG